MLNEAQKYRRLLQTHQDMLSLLHINAGSRRDYTTSKCTQVGNLSLWPYCLVLRGHPKLSQAGKELVYLKKMKIALSFIL